ncbi:hypothetical protein SEA_FIRECASTLE_60 [Microbacterium phage FireCastle]
MTRGRRVQLRAITWRNDLSSRFGPAYVGHLTTVVPEFGFFGVHPVTREFSVVSTPGRFHVIHEWDRK